jgi:hypothetical protein
VRFFHRIPFPRPQNDAIRWHIRELAHNVEILCFMRTIRAKEPAREISFNGF